MPFEKYVIDTFTNSEFLIGECKNISSRSMLKNRALIYASDITLLRSNFFNRSVADDSELDSYGNPYYY